MPFRCRQRFSAGRVRCGIESCYVYLCAYASVPEDRIGRYFAFYNIIRPNSALSDRTPDQVYSQSYLLQQRDQLAATHLLKPSL